MLFRSMSTAAPKSGLSTKQIVSWIFTLGLPLLILLIPTNEVFTSEIKIFLALTLMAIMTFAFENVNQTLVALALPALYIAFQIAPSARVLQPWTQATPWMVLGGLLLADALTENGLLKRIAYKCIILTGGSYRGIIFGLLLCGIVLNIIIPTKAAIPMAALSFGICKALDLGKSKASAGIMLTAAVAAVATPSVLLFNPNYFIMVNAGMEATGPITITWMEYFKNNAVSLIYLIGTACMAYLVFKPKHEVNGKSYFLSEYGKLGNISTAEIKSIGVVAFLLLSLLTTKYHGVDTGWCFALIPLILFLPGVNAASQNVIKNCNFGFIIFVGSCKIGRAHV